MDSLEYSNRDVCLSECLITYFPHVVPLSTKMDSEAMLKCLVKEGIYQEYSVEEIEGEDPSSSLVGGKGFVKGRIAQKFEEHDDEDRDRRRNDFPVWGWVLLVIVGLIFICCLLAWAYSAYGKNNRKSSEPQFL